MLREDREVSSACLITTRAASTNIRGSCATRAVPTASSISGSALSIMHSPWAGSRRISFANAAAISSSGGKVLGIGRAAGREGGALAGPLVVCAGRSAWRVEAKLDRRDGAGGGAGGAAGGGGGARGGHCAATGGSWAGG